MPVQQKPEPRRDEGVSGFIWNVIGGALVSAMLAGTMYVLMGMIGQVALDDSSFWEMQHLKYYFIGSLIVYLVMPTVLSNVLGMIFGGKSKASGSWYQR